MILWRWLIFLGALMWCGLCLVDTYAHKIIRCYPELEFAELAFNTLLDPILVTKQSVFNDISRSENSERPVIINEKPSNDKNTQVTFYSNILLMSAIFGCYGLIDFIRLHFNGFSAGIKISEVVHEKVKQLKRRCFGCATMVVATGSFMGQLGGHNDTFVASQHTQIQDTKATHFDNIIKKVSCIETASSINCASVKLLDSAKHNLKLQTEIASMSLRLSKMTLTRSVDLTGHANSYNESIYSVTTIKKGMNVKMIDSESAIEEDIVTIQNLSTVNEGDNNLSLDPKVSRYILEDEERARSKNSKKTAIPRRNSNVIKVKAPKDVVYGVKEVLTVSKAKPMKAYSSKSSSPTGIIRNSTRRRYLHWPEESKIHVVTESEQFQSLLESLQTENQRSRSPSPPFLCG